MKKLTLCGFFHLLFVLSSSAQITIIPFNDSWKYLDNGTNQGTAWRDGSFSDASWKTGIGKFGYGISGANTIISYGPDKFNKYVTTYFRKTINVLNPADFPFYLANIKRDDGAVVYVNGAEIYRSNMPIGSINYTTLASTSASDNGSTAQSFNINSSSFVAGSNVIAVEIHQRKTSSTEKDMAFDFSLQSPDTIPPVVLSINRQSPAADPTNATSVTFRATFSEAVSGVDAADFSLITGSTASGVISTATPVGTSGSVYDVTVTSVTGNGTLRLDLNSSGTGISDAAGNGISGGYSGGQTYTIQQGAPTLTSVSIASNNVTPSLAKPGDVVSLSFTASEAINPPAVMIATHAVTAAAGAGNTFTASYTMIVSDAAGIVPFSINFSSTDNIPGTPVTTTTNGSSVNYDNSVPAVVSINRQSPAADPTNATSVTFRATFSEGVSGVDAADFSLTAGGTASGVISTATPVGTSGSVYDVTVTSVSGNGTLRLDLKATGTGISDAAGNAISGGYTGGQTYTIQQSPIVLSISRQIPTAENTSAAAVTWRVIFSVPVTGVDAADFIASPVSGNVRGTLASLAIQTIGTTGTVAVQPVGTQGTTYDVSVRALSGTGTLRLDIKSSNTGITSSTGAPLTGGYTGQTYNIQSVSGFPSFSDINSVPLSTHTAEKPQSKVWNYAGKWWAVLSTSGGTIIYRLDGNTWTETLKLNSSSNAKADCIVAGNITHILLYRRTTSYVFSVQYDAATNAYKLWSQRPAGASIVFESGAQTATIAMDGNGRMWLANDGVTDMYLRWSDAPYSSWSAPITIESGALDDDLCALVALPGKLGIMWSNQKTQRFGFKTHTNGSSPTLWSADESPGAQSALSIGKGFADNHISLTTASDGTLYAAIKTSYDIPGQLKLGLLVRNTSGIWSNPYPVTANEGTRPIVLLNEAAGKLKVIYTSLENGGDILYRESSTTNISFGGPLTLIGGNPSILYNYTTSTHETYNPEIVILATDVSGGTSSFEAVGVIANENSSPLVSSSVNAPTLPQAGIPAADGNMIEGTMFAYPNPFINNTVLSFTVPEESDYTISMYNSLGAKMRAIYRGKAIAGKLNIVNIDGSRLAQGVYLLQIKTKSGTKSIKVLRAP